VKKRVWSILLVVVIIIAVLPGVQASGLICFVGVNDTIPISLSASETPFYSGGSLYIPYTAFSAGPNGVVVSHDAAEQQLVLFTRVSRLVYDIEAGTVTDENDIVKKVTVSYRNGILFIPAVQAASHFGLSVSLLTSKTGCQVIRFTNGQHVYNNDEFIKKAETLISFYLEYNASQEAQNPTGNGDDIPQEDVVPPEDQDPATVYLAIAGAAVSEQTMNYLKQMNIPAAFFVTEQQLLEEKELMRKIYASGYTIGLTVEAGVTDVEAALVSANAAMDKTLFCRSVLVLLPEGMWESQSYRLLLEQSQARSIDAILTQDVLQPRLLVCRSEPTKTIDRLVQSNAVFVQLLDTTVITG